MKIHVGFDLTYESALSTPMIFMLNCSLSLSETYALKYWCPQQSPCNASDATLHSALMFAVLMIGHLWLPKTSDSCVSMV